MRQKFLPVFGMRRNRIMPIMAAARPNAACPVPMAAEKLRCSRQTAQPVGVANALKNENSGIFMQSFSNNICF